MSEEERKTIEDIKIKIKDTLPLYEETIINGEVYRLEIIQIETRWTEETAKKVQVLVDLLEKQDRMIDLMANDMNKGIGYYTASKEEMKELYRRKVEKC